MLQQSHDAEEKAANELGFLINKPFYNLMTLQCSWIGGATFQLWSIEYGIVFNIWQCYVVLDFYKGPTNRIFHCFGATMASLPIQISTQLVIVVQDKFVQFFCFHGSRQVSILGEKEVVWSQRILLVVKHNEDYFLEPCVVWFLKSFGVALPCNIVLVVVYKRAWVGQKIPSKSSMYLFL